MGNGGRVRIFIKYSDEWKMRPRININRVIWDSFGNCWHTYWKLREQHAILEMICRKCARNLFIQLLNGQVKFIRRMFLKENVYFVCIMLINKACTFVILCRIHFSWKFVVYFLHVEWSLICHSVALERWLGPSRCSQNWLLLNTVNV